MALWSWRLRPGKVREASPAERRATPRYVAGRVTGCHVIALPANVPVAVTLRDLSVAGLGLTSDVYVGKGTFLVVRLAGANQVCCTRRARVVHASVQPDGKWLLGCVLTEELSPAALHALM
jgi:hypothetical protein